MTTPTSVPPQSYIVVTQPELEALTQNTVHEAIKTLGEKGALTQDFYEQHVAPKPEPKKESFAEKAGSWLLKRVPFFGKFFERAEQQNKTPAANNSSGSSTSSAKTEASRTASSEPPAWLLEAANWVAQQFGRQAKKQS